MRKYLLLLMILSLLLPAFAKPGMKGRYRNLPDKSPDQKIKLYDVSFKFSKSGKLTTTFHRSDRERFSFHSGGQRTVTLKDGRRVTFSANWDDDLLYSTTTFMTKGGQPSSRTTSVWAVSKNGRDLARQVTIESGGRKMEFRTYYARI